MKKDEFETKKNGQVEKERISINNQNSASYYDSKEDNTSDFYFSTQLEIISIKTKVDSSRYKKLEIKFNDGCKFKNILYNRENLDKLNKLVDEQRKRKIKEQLQPAIKFQTKAAIMTFFTASTAIASTVSLPVESDDNTLWLAVGTVSLSASIGLFLKMLKNHKKIANLQKYAFYNDGTNASKLNEFNKYENSLACISRKKQLIIRNVDEPFSQLFLDYYSKKDLKRIVSNIEREKICQFTYSKKNT